MKRIFYTGVFGLLLFEFLKIYFIMPFPGARGSTASRSPISSILTDGSFEPHSP